MLVLAVRPHDGRLAVGVHRPAQRHHRAAAEQVAQLLAGLDQLLQVVDEAARERVLDHRDRGHLPDRLLDAPAAVLVDLLHHREQLADFHQWPPADRGPAGLALDHLRRARGGRGVPAPPDLDLPVDENHGDPEEIADPERLERGPALRADRRVHDAEVRLAPRRDHAHGQLVDPRGVAGGHAHRLLGGERRRATTRWASTRRMPSGTTPVPDGASRPMMMRSVRLRLRGRGAGRGARPCRCRSGRSRAPSGWPPARRSRARSSRWSRR